MKAFAVVAFTVLLWGPMQAFAACESENCRMFQKDFQLLIQNSEKVYCYTEQKQADHGKDYAQLAQEYFNLLDDKMTNDEYIWLLRKWAAEFHDGHVNFMARKFGLDFHVTALPIALSLLEPGTPQETLIVTSSKDEKIPVGSIIEKINGKSVQEAITAAAPFASGSTERMVRRGAGVSVLSILSSIEKSTEFTLDLKADEGKTTEVRIKGEKKLFGSLPDVEDDKKSVFSEMLPGGILYVRISQFMQNTAVEFGQVIVDHDLKQIKGIVLDLRRNRGGIPSEYMEILTLFVKKPITLYQTSPRVNEVTIGYRPSLKGLPLIEGTEFAAWRPQRTDEDVDGRLSDIPLITLTSPYCFSACDTMVSAMKHNGIGKILGEPTAGGTGQPIVFDLPGSEHMFRYSVVRGKTILNDWLEGVGTQPDVYIPQTTKDIVDGKDYQLEQSLEHFPAGLIPNIFAPVARPLVVLPTDKLKFTPEVWEQYLTGLGR